jgi:dCMP deaminase
MSNQIPEHDQYFMGIAMAVRKRANCLGNRVGAVVVQDKRVLATGYNGTPENMENCMDGGCHRCSKRDQYPSGTGYDLCICVHAEQNAILAAARFGIPIAGASVYSTMRPCFGCTKEMLQAKISAVHFIHDWAHPDADKQAEYSRLQARFPDGIRRIQIDDPDAAWAVSTLRIKARGSADETGHQE